MLKGIDVLGMFPVSSSGNYWQPKQGKLSNEELLRGVASLRHEVSDSSTADWKAEH